MGFKDKFHIHSSGDNGGDQQQSSTKRRRSQFNLVTPDQVTEHSLQVWRALPAEIRHDPSMASFQMENDRLRGGSSEPTDNETRKEESSNEDDISCTGSEYISMKKLGKHDKAEKYLGEKSSDIDEQSSDHENLDDSSDKSKTRRNIERKIKKGCLMIFWLFTAGTLIVTREKELVVKTLSIPAQSEKLYTLPQNPLGDIKMKIFGAFNESVRMTPETENYLTLQLQLVHDFGPNGTESAQDILKPWLIPIVPDHEFDTAPLQTTNRTMELPRDVINKLDGGDAYKIRLKIYTNNATNDLTIRLIYDPLVIDVVTGTLLAALILSIFYALLVWEIFHRTFVAVICSMASIAILAVLGDRPTMDEIVYWMDMEMLTLLFAMMLLIGIMTETGIFDYIAVVAFEISGGKIWPMIYSLCIITCFISSFLDNMTTVLLMTPVAIRLCEVMSLDPVPVLMGIIVHSNIGGSLTPIGDPISIIICSNHFIAKSGVTFMEFVAHTIPGVILTVLQSCIYMRLVFWDIKSLRPHEPKEIKELRREIKVWQRTAYSLSSFSKDVDLVRETLLKKVKILKHKLKKKLAGVGSNDVYVATLEDLKLKYPIKKKLQLIQSLVALAFIIICFFIQSVPSMRTLPLGWVALLGLIALLIVLNRDDMEHMLHHIEWTTLLFFAAMFVMMECVERLGLITWIGEVTEDIILMVDRKQRLPMAIFIILWISALASAILDSIPVTAMMVKVVVSLVAKESLGLPLEPLVWALAFGPCLGGNGTLYGASANVLSAGMAEQHGYKISFTRYLKVVFPMMLGQVTVITIYLMLSHIAFEWHLIN